MLLGLAGLVVLLIAGLYLEVLEWVGVAGWLLVAGACVLASHLLGGGQLGAMVALVILDCILIMVVFKGDIELQWPIGRGPGRF